MPQADHFAATNTAIHIERMVMLHEEQPEPTAFLYGVR